MNISKSDVNKLVKKLDKIDEYKNKIEKEVDEVKAIFKNSLSSTDASSNRRSRRKTPSKLGGAKKVVVQDSDSDPDNISLTR